MTRRERLERKLEKREEWAEGRRTDASRRFANAHNATAGIPFGQPILVGHHSEGRHRAALARQDSNMRAGCESSDMAAHHASKAAGIERQLACSVFSDDDDAIEQLEAKITEAQEEQNRHKAINKIVKRKPKNEPTAEKLADLVALGMSEATAGKLFEKDFAGRIGIPSYELTNNNANISRMKKRIEEIKRRQGRQAEAEASGGVSIEMGSEWCGVTFAEKPEREILDALKAAGFHWGGGRWIGPTAAIPACVHELAQLERGNA